MKSMRHTMCIKKLVLGEYIMLCLAHKFKQLPNLKINSTFSCVRIHNQKIKSTNGRPCSSWPGSKRVQEGCGRQAAIVMKWWCLHSCQSPCYETGLWLINSMHHHAVCTDFSLIYGYVCVTPVVICVSTINYITDEQQHLQLLVVKCRVKTL